MSLKINIPRTSKAFQEALKAHLLGMADDKLGLYSLINKTAGNALDVDASYSMPGLGGCKTIDQLLASVQGFDLATCTEYLTFKRMGFSGADFLHILLDAYLDVELELAISKERIIKV